MKSLIVVMALSIATLVGLVCMRVQATQSGENQESPVSQSNISSVSNAKLAQGALANPQTSSNSGRSLVLVASLTVFVLSVFVGFEIIAKVPPTLHTPLMSGSNAISGITVVGAIIAAGYKETGFGSFFGMVAIVLAMINVVGGFLVTHRMLLMFKKR